MLLNHTINGWSVLQERGTYRGMSGGNFSSGYIVEKDGQKAYLKAMDLHGAMTKGLPAVQETVNQYMFEKDILGFCRDRRLSGIVRLHEAGEYQPAGSNSPFDVVHYLIFELADGDIRREITVEGAKSDYWKLRVLHQSAGAIIQLHGEEIAHQDVKPSNVFAFRAADKFKLGDLGRCTSKQFKAPSDAYIYPGDLNYAPPEYHYNDSPPQSYVDQRQGSDAYLLGSLITFLFSMGVGALNMTLRHLPPTYWPATWTGPYADALPYLVSAHTEATMELKQTLPDSIREEMATAYFQLCHPNPVLRGHPDARRQAGRPLGLDRYRSLFDRMSHKVKLSKTPGKAA